MLGLQEFYQRKKKGGFGETIEVAPFSPNISASMKHFDFTERFSKFMTQRSRSLGMFGFTDTDRRSAQLNPLSPQIPPA